jgi:hypothetical protein
MIPTRKRACLEVVFVLLILTLQYAYGEDNLINMRYVSSLSRKNKTGIMTPEFDSEEPTEQIPNRQIVAKMGLNDA